MSLKAFHIFFIIVSTLLAFGFGLRARMYAAATGELLPLRRFWLLEREFFDLASLRIVETERRFETPSIQHPLVADLGDRVGFLGYDLEETTDVIRRALAFDGVAVVVTRRECMLQILRRERKYREPYTVTEDCVFCGECVKLGCPAITFSEEEGAGVDPILCVGCDICAQLCPFGAFVPMEEAG